MHNTNDAMWGKAVRQHLLLLCSVLHISNKCLEEDVPVFKYSIQDIVDELEVTCSGMSFQALLKSLSCLYANATSPKYSCWAVGDEKDMQAHKS